MHNRVSVTSVFTEHRLPKRSIFPTACSLFILILFHYCYYVRVPLQSFLFSPIIYLVSRLSIAPSNGGVLLTLFSLLHLILNRYLSVFLISITFVQFNTFLWATFSFILKHYCTNYALQFFFSEHFNNRRICSAPPFPKHRGRLPLLNTVLIPLNIKISAFNHTISLFYFFYSYQRNYLHLSYISVRNNIATKTSNVDR